MISPPPAAALPLSHWNWNSLHTNSIPGAAPEHTEGWLTQTQRGSPPRLNSWFVQELRGGEGLPLLSI